MFIKKIGKWRNIAATDIILYTKILVKVILTVTEVRYTISIESYRRYVGGVAAQLLHEEVMVDSRGGILLCLIEQAS